MVSNEHKTSLTVFIFEVKFWKYFLYGETTPYSLNVNNSRQVMTFFHLENNIWIKFNMNFESMIAVSSSNSVILRKEVSKLPLHLILIECSCDYIVGTLPRILKI